MGTFGERLQREREMRGITLEEISESTKISTRSLEALEHEEFDKLPGGIFNKGFVRAYARFVGIDEEQAVADFIAVAGETEQPLPSPVPRPRSPETLAPETVNWRGVVVVVLLFSLAAAALWKLAPRAYRSAKLGAEAVRVRLSRRTPPPPPVIPATPAAQPAEPGSLPVVEAAEPATAPAPDKRRKSALKTAKAAENAEKPHSQSADGFVVLIRAREDSWVSITADGKPFSARLLNADSVEEVRATREVVLKTGNAHGVDVSYNGKPVSLGDREVTTVTFTPDGIQR